MAEKLLIGQKTEFQVMQTTEIEGEAIAITLVDMLESFKQQFRNRMVDTKNTRKNKARKATKKK